MSKIFEALHAIQSTNVHQAHALPTSLQKSRMPESGNYWKERYYPKFTDFKIDHFLDYLLSLHGLSSGAKYGIVPVSDSPAISEIVLETFMHLSANCEGSTLLTDLSSDRLVLKLLDESNSFDQQFPPNDSAKVLPILHNLFHFLSIPRESSQSKHYGKIHYPELMKLTEIYSFSLFLFPPASKFNTDNVQLARQVDNMILVSPKNAKQDLIKTDRFLDNLGVKSNGVYLFD